MSPPPPSLAILPAVDRVLKYPAVLALAAQHGRVPTTKAVRKILDGLRERARKNELTCHAVCEETLVQQIAALLQDEATPRLRPVYNLSGTVLHTNLGRALLPEEAVRAVTEVMRRPCNLEYDLTSGRRGERDALVEDLLCEITGAEAALVVNNNAAAVLLALNALAARREVIVSRGELIEIGGAFRIPDVMARAGCRLREVGTTNRTHLRDFAEAIGPRTAALLKVHTSNYAIQGFTCAPEERSLAELAHAHRLPLLVDLGSGTLVDLAQWGLPREPIPQQSLAVGVDLVTFSGDKLLGGPQAGIVVGRRELVERLRKNPLKRALRVDKLTYAALEAVLRLYRDPQILRARLPTLRLLTRNLADIEATARQVANALAARLGAAAQVSVAPCASQIGSGALPLKTLPSRAVVIAPARRRGAGRWLARLEKAMRAMPVPVIGRIEADGLWLDMRCLEAADLEGFLGQLVCLNFAP